MTTLLPLASRTASGSGVSFDILPHRALRAVVDVTDYIPGTATAVALKLETSTDGIAWRDAGFFVPIEGEGEQEAIFASLRRFVRVSWDADDATFEATVEAELVPMYASLAAFYGVGLPKKLVSKVAEAQALEAIASASAKVDSYLAARVTLPLITYSAGALRRATAIIAAYDWLTANGYNPEGESENYRLRYLDELKWLEAIANNDLPLPPGIEDSTPSTTEGTPGVDSDPLRGW